MHDTTMPAFKVYAPDGAVWSHPRLTRFGVWLRVHGWWGWLPYKGVRTCTAVYPALQCPCNMYALIWKEMDYGCKDED